MRNRDPTKADHSCRVCGTHEERISSLIDCPHIKPFWDACFKFCENVIGSKTLRLHSHAIIFGLRTHTTLATEATRAFLRHAYGSLYHDFSNIDLKHTHLVWQRTFWSAVRSFSNAVRRFGMTLRTRVVNRIYTKKPLVLSEELRQRFPTLIEIDPSGNFTLTQTLQSACDDAHQRATDAMAAGHARRLFQRAAARG